MKLHTYISHLLSLLLLVSACEKPQFADDASTNGGSTTTEQRREGEHLVHFTAFSVSQLPFEGASVAHKATATPLAEACSRITMAVFDADGKRQKIVSQQRGDATFGSFTISLPEGLYTFVFIAHNGTAVPTITKPSEVKFKDNRLSDTFYHTEVLNITDDSQTAITLQRAVAMVRFVFNDNTPTNIKQIKFFYTGGSSTLDPTTGYGCVNSRQTEVFTVPNTAYTSGSVYQVYTFPHANGKNLTLTVSALDGIDANATAHYVRTFEDIEVQRNYITQCTGSFYGEDPDGARSFTLTVNDNWGYTTYEY